MRFAHTRRADRARARGERGAVLVELALVAVLLTTLVAGTYDYGMGWRASLAVTEAARTGARVGSAQGPAPSADFALLSGTRSALASSGLLDETTRVVIYNATTADGNVPATCKTTTSASIAQQCTILTGAQLRTMPAIPGPGTLDAKGCLAAAQTRKWCPTDRVNVQLNANYLGVWVQVKYEFQFRLLGTSRKIERDAVMRLEPKES